MTDLMGTLDSLPTPNRSQDRIMERFFGGMLLSRLQSMFPGSNIEGIFYHRDENKNRVDYILYGIDTEGGKISVGIKFNFDTSEKKVSKGYEETEGGMYILPITIRLPIIEKGYNGEGGPLSIGTLKPISRIWKNINMHHSRPLESARESWQDDDRINLSMGTVHAIIDDFPYEVRSFLRQIRLALNGTIVGNTVAKTVAHH